MPVRDEGPGMAHAGRGLPGPSAPSRRNSMTDTDLHQADPGGTQQAMNTALGGVLRAFGYPIAPFGSGGAWLVTGRRGTEAGR